MYGTYSLWRTGKAVLESGSGTGFVCVPLDEVGHRVLGALAVHDLLRGVVRVGDVRPRHVLEVLATLQFTCGLANLEIDKSTF